MHVYLCSKANERLEGKENCSHLKKQKTHDGGGGIACMTEKTRELAEKKKADRQEAPCDNLAEETGLCSQHCLETENIFNWGGFGLDHLG